MSVTSVEAIRVAPTGDLATAEEARVRGDARAIDEIASDISELAGSES